MPESSKQQGTPDAVKNADLARTLPRSVEWLSGNSVSVLHNFAFFERLLESISEARLHVHLEFYIVRNDETGRRLATVLKDAIARGVEVRLIYDHVGSFSLDNHVFLELERAGAMIAAYNKLTPVPWRWNFSRFTRRDHRKLAIIDGNRAFVGSGNIGREYSSRDAHSFLDSFTELTGPIVRVLAVEFIGVWQRTTGQRLGRGMIPNPSPDGNVPVAAIANRTLTRRRWIESTHIRAIRSATRTVRLANPYFVPSGRVRRALYAAAEKGVKVEIMLPAAPNWHLVSMAARFHYGQMLDRGIRIVERKYKMLHNKYAVIDGIWTAIGSYNFDALSQWFNLELDIVILDEVVATELEQHFENELNQCQVIDPEHWRDRSLPERWLEWLASRLARWM